MQEGEGLTHGHVGEPALPSSNHQQDTNTIAVEVAAMDDDAMDTTPDLDAELVQADSELDPPEAAALTSNVPPTNGAAVDEPLSNDQLPPAAPSADAVSDDAA